MRDRLLSWFGGLLDSLRILRNLRAHLDELKMLQAEPVIRQIRAMSSVKSLRDVETKVFSQWGDDGVVQWLDAHLPAMPRTFVEIGVEDYLESTTRYLLMRSDWSGLIIDASARLIARIRRSHYYWRHELQARQAMVSAENVNELLEEAGISGEIGLLHIDIDGMDYWIWKALTHVRPTVVIVEYNSVFGSDRAITVPYEPRFNRTSAHYSNLLFGASLLALCDLGVEKGYRFIGATSSGNNAYFVREDCCTAQLPQPSPSQGYVRSKFRESRDLAGRLDFRTGAERLATIKGMRVFDTRAGEEVEFVKSQKVRILRTRIQL